MWCCVELTNKVASWLGIFCNLKGTLPVVLFEKNILQKVCRKLVKGLVDALAGFLLVGGGGLVESTLLAKNLTNPPH